MSGVRKSKMIKEPVLAGLGGKGLRKRDGQIGQVINFFPPRGQWRRKVVEVGGAEIIENM